MFHFSNPDLYIVFEKMSMLDEHGIVIPIVEWNERKVTVDAINRKIKISKRMMRSHFENVYIGGVKLAVNQFFFDFKIVNRKQVLKMGVTQQQITDSVKTRQPIEI